MEKYPENTSLATLEAQQPCKLEQPVRLFDGEDKDWTIPKGS